MRKVWAGGAVLGVVLLAGGLAWRSQVRAERRHELLALSQVQPVQAAESLGVEALRAELIQANEARLQDAVRAYAQDDARPDWLLDRVGQANAAVAMLQTWKDAPLGGQQADLSFQAALGAAKGKAMALQAWTDQHKAATP